MKALTLLQDYYHDIIYFTGKNNIDEAIAELEALQQPKRCDGCWYVKITINSVICGKNGTFKEADDYCKYYNPKEQ